MNKNKETVCDPIYFKGESEGITVECAFQYVNEFHENVLGFCNNIYNAEGGTHLTGFKSTFTTVMNTYARELGILKEKDPNFTGADIRNGMTAVISVQATRIPVLRGRQRQSWTTRMQRRLWEK